jgi:adenylate kinase family enzyme
MNIANNIISNKLKEVYFVTGSSCGGKTTAAIELNKKYGMYHYNSDEMRSKHFANSDILEQPALSRNVPD